MEYGHWGITVWQRQHETDYAPFYVKSFGYPVVNSRGPVDSAETEEQAMEHCRSLGGIPKGPFFTKADRNKVGRQPALVA